ncbi:hypothetical protein [Lyngbya confervoides]|uniref:Nif11 domain-containing protein n=1 Tax=Lyngbya confervoides BDU141951 TaxID=1574623 RepID=A0ABD4T1H6_9CYAN|nr:hypothetical protein [Lyngbya confervoides]MCM1982303.1 hypothetical protein [Lyngbya confervoides BDU141951]
MATQSVVEFMRVTAANEKIRLQLETLLGVGDGDISSVAALDAEESAALKGERGALVTEFAATQGFTFSIAELTQVIEAFEKVQSGAMTPQAFEKQMGAPMPDQNPSPLRRIAKFLSKTYLGYS